MTSQYETRQIISIQWIKQAGTVWSKFLVKNAYHFTSEQFLWFLFKDKKFYTELTDKGKLIAIFNSTDYWAVGGQASFHSWYSSL